MKEDAESIKSQRGTDLNGEPIVSYFRDRAQRVIYRYEGGSRLYDAATGEPVGNYTTTHALSDLLGPHQP